MIDLSKLSPAELIRVAIKDMKATIASGLHIDMATWGANVGTVNCAVCFAGSVMLQGGVQPVAGGFSVDRGMKYENQYRALDAIRQGKLMQFCAILDVPLPAVVVNNLVIDLEATDYIVYKEGNEEEFYAKMEGFAQLLDGTAKIALR